MIENCGKQRKYRKCVTREQIIERVLENKIIAIVRGVYGEDCLDPAKALYEGGIKLLEVTFVQSNPGSLYRTADAVGVGGNLVNKEWIAAGEFDKITALAREFTANL